jgi:hypothetical protein
LIKASKIRHDLRLRVTKNEQDLEMHHAAGSNQGSVSLVSVAAAARSRDRRYAQGRGRSEGGCRNGTLPRRLRFQAAEWLAGTLLSGIVRTLRAGSFASLFCVPFAGKISCKPGRAARPRARFLVV